MKYLDITAKSVPDGTHLIRTGEGMPLVENNDGSAWAAFSSRKP